MSSHRGLSHLFVLGIGLLSQQASGQPRHETTCRRGPRPTRLTVVPGTLHLVPLRDGPGLRVLRPHRASGTSIAVRRLEEVAAEYRARFPLASTVWVHDMSRRGGGPLDGHFSHRDGRDADIRVPLRVRAGYVDATRKTLDAERTWFLLLALIATCDVEFIMLDRELQAVLHRHAQSCGTPPAVLEKILEYPARLCPFEPENAVVRHYPRHRNHLHVRFRAAGRPLQQHSAALLCAPSPGFGARPPILHVVQSARLRHEPKTEVPTL